MDYGQILKRSWHMVRYYRALWIFGIVLGLVTFSWELALLGNGDDERQSPQGVVITPLAGETFYDALERTLQEELDGVEGEMSIALREIDRFFTTELGRRFVVDAVTVLAVLTAAFVVTLIVNKIARYVSEAALIRMVGDYEDTGERRGVRQGLRLGLSRTAWRLFLIDLVIDVPVILAFLVLFTMAFAPVILGIMSSAPTTVIAGSLLTGGLFAAGVALAIVAGTLLSLLKRFFRQACALESLRLGRCPAQARRRAGDVADHGRDRARLGQRGRPQLCGPVPPPAPVHGPRGIGRCAAGLPGVPAFQPGLWRRRASTPGGAGRPAHLYRGDAGPVVVCRRADAGL
jgi:hypothetical protein